MARPSVASEVVQAASRAETARVSAEWLDPGVSTMPLPAPLKPLLRTRRFWTDFLWVTEPCALPGGGLPYPELQVCRVDLPVADGFELRLSLDEYLALFQLDLAAPGHDSVNIAWDDQAHWHPHVLRWKELETICRSIAMQQSELSHPGHAVLLLHRFALICEDDDSDAIVATLETAWTQLGLFTKKEITSWIERIDARDSGFRWQWNEPKGWSIEQDEGVESGRQLYSLRRSGNEQFPFADWGRMIAAAEREVAMLRAPDHPAAAAKGPVQRPGRELPLDLDQPSTEPIPLVLQLCKLKTIRWRHGHRFDRVQLSGETQRSLREWLTRFHALGPDEDGWYRVATDDGGQWDLCAPRLNGNSNLDGITIAFRRLTPDASSLAHRLMSDEGLMLLPPLLAPNTDVAGQVSAPWPAVRVVVSPETLYEILSAGSYTWWASERPS